MSKLGAHIAIAALAGLLAAGCTVQPLYAPAGPSAIGSPAALASIYVAEVDSRVGQKLRNRLIFLMNGGGGQPLDAEYQLAMTVSTTSSDLLAIDTSDIDEPTAEKVTVTVNYTLTRVSDDTVLAKRRSVATASFDVSGQEFANIRAERDAENRAAEELAERLRGLVAADLKRAGAI